MKTRGTYRYKNTLNLLVGFIKAKPLENLDWCICALYISIDTGEFCCVSKKYFEVHFEEISADYKTGSVNLTFRSPEQLAEEC